MKILRIAINGLVLMLADVAGIVMGAAVAYRLLGVSNQVWLQLPVAVILTPALFFAWLFLVHRMRFTRLQFAHAREQVACLAVSLVVGPAVFVPLHYLTQGYLTDPGNLVSLAFYQLPVNTLTLLGAWGLFGPRPTGLPAVPHKL